MQTCPLPHEGRSPTSPTQIQKTASTFYGLEAGDLWCGLASTDDQNCWLALDEPRMLGLGHDMRVGFFDAVYRVHLGDHQV